MCYNSSRMKLFRAGIKFSLILLFTAAIGLSGFNVCPALCGSVTNECHNKLEQSDSQCRSDLLAEKNSEEKCQCYHSVKNATIKEPQFFTQLGGSQQLKQIPLSYVELLSKSQSTLHKGNQALGPPGHLLSSLLTYLSHSKHSPPLTA